MTSGTTDGTHQVRTALAWRRTVLAAAVVVLLMARLAVQVGAPLRAVLLVGTAGAGWLVVAAVAAHRLRRLHRVDNPVARRALIVVTCATVGYAVAGLVLVALTPR